MSASTSGMKETFCHIEQFLSTGGLRKFNFFMAGISAIRKSIIVMGCI